MSLITNALLEWTQGSIMRVLWFNQEDVILITVNDPYAFPEIHSRRLLEDALLKHSLRLLTIDPYVAEAWSDEQLTEAERSRRDRAWSIIHPLVEDHLPNIFLRDKRGKLLATRSQEVGMSLTSCYGYLRRYWQGGQTPNALLPRYKSSGSPGAIRADGGKKRGRPSSLTTEGINVTDEMREAFRKGIRRFYESGRVKSLRDAYQRTLEQYFHQGHVLQDGVMVAILPDANALPTFWQFEYWYYKDRDLSRSLTKRKGQTRFNLEDRALLGESTSMAFGPGSVYQIDATVGDIYLVSELNPQQIIGRPVIYLVIDVFSRMVVGLSVTLEGPSWLGAMLALENATTEKTTFCERYGVRLKDGEWPCQHLPEMLIADRGELEGYNGDQIANALNIVVATTAPYRADMKGIVEQAFRLANLRVMNTLPGAVEERERGTADYRQEASLTLSQLTTLLIQGVLYHNQHHYIADYPLDRAMLRDDVTAQPLELWLWGIQNRTGHLRTLPAETIRLSLLPQAEATVTREGIRFRKLYYTCPTATEAGWYVKAGQTGRWNVRVSYDPRFVDCLYLWHDGDRQIEVCKLIDNARMQVFRGLDWDTVETHASYQALKRKTAFHRQQKGRAVLNAHKDAVVRQAENALPDKHPKKQVRDITRNRQLERQRQRQEDAWQLTEAVTQDETKDATEGYTPPAQYLDLLRDAEGQHDTD